MHFLLSLSPRRPPSLPEPLPSLPPSACTASTALSSSLLLALSTLSFLRPPARARNLFCSRLEPAFPSFPSSWPALMFCPPAFAVSHPTTTVSCEGQWRLQQPCPEELNTPCRIVLGVARCGNVAPTRLCRSLRASKSESRHHSSFLSLGFASSSSAACARLAASSCS